MKCCGCSKEINIDKPFENMVPTWFGKFQKDKLVKIICSECIKDLKKKEEYKGSLV